MRLLAIPPVLLIALAGCGGADTVSRAEVEKRVQEGLTEGVGQQAPPASCPNELKAEVGASTRCTMDFPEGKRLGITVKIDKVEGNRVNFDIEADQKLTDTP